MSLYDIHNMLEDQLKKGHVIPIYDIHKRVEEELKKIISRESSDYMLIPNDFNIIENISRYLLISERDYVHAWFTIRSLSRNHRNKFIKFEICANMGSVRAVGMLIGFKSTDISAYIVRMYGKPKYKSVNKNQVFYECKLCGTNMRSAKKNDHVERCPKAKMVRGTGYNPPITPCKKCNCVIHPNLPKLLPGPVIMTPGSVCPCSDYRCDFCDKQINIIEYHTRHFNVCGSIRDRKCKWCETAMTRIEFVTHERCPLEYNKCIFCKEPVYMNDYMKRNKHDTACETIKKEATERAVCADMSKIIPMLTHRYLDAVNETRDITVLKEVSSHFLPDGTLKIEYGISEDKLHINDVEGKQIARGYLPTIFYDDVTIISLTIANFSLLLIRRYQNLNGNDRIIYYCKLQPVSSLNAHPVILRKFASLQPITIRPDGGLNFVINE